MSCVVRMYASMVLYTVTSQTPTHKTPQNDVVMMMQANNTCTAAVSDVSATAVSNLQSQAESMGILSDRLQAFVSDATDPVNYARASAPFETKFGLADIVLLIFTLSAVSPDAMGQALQTAWTQLRPGGMLLIRDYGRFDMTALRFPPEQRIADGLYFRCVSCAGIPTDVLLQTCPPSW